MLIDILLFLNLKAFANFHKVCLLLCKKIPSERVGVDCGPLKYSPNNLVLGKMLSKERKVAQLHGRETQSGRAGFAGISCLTGLLSVCGTIME